MSTTREFDNFCNISVAFGVKMTGVNSWLTAVFKAKILQLEKMDFEKKKHKESDRLKLSKINEANRLFKEIILMFLKIWMNLHAF